MVEVARRMDADKVRFLFLTKQLGDNTKNDSWAKSKPERNPFDTKQNCHVHRYNLTIFVKFLLHLVRSIF